MKLLIVVCAIAVIMSQANSARIFSLSDIIHAYAEGLADGNNAVNMVSPKEVLNVPTTLKDCNNGSCDSICKALGFNHGSCVSSSTCRCYN